MMLKNNILEEVNSNILASLDLRQKVLASGRTPKTRLLALSRQLSHWNIARNAQQNAQAKELSIEDVHALKEIIHSEIEKTSIKHPEVVSDQILFLVIGAIQIQSQNHSDDAWKLVSQSIQSFLKPEKEQRIFTLGAVVTALVALFVSATLLLNPKMNDASDVLAIDKTKPTATIGVADPLTISALQHVYNKMKDGTCQFPQAAMLPIEQRQAFLSFVNEGIVDMHNVINLKLALGYVNCLYPQELMHSPI